MPHGVVGLLIRWGPQPIGLLYPTHESTQVKKALKAAKVQR